MSARDHYEPGDEVPRPGPYEPQRPYELHRGEGAIPDAALSAFIEAKGIKAVQREFGRRAALRRRLRALKQKRPGDA